MINISEDKTPPTDVNCDDCIYAQESDFYGFSPTDNKWESNICHRKGAPRLYKNVRGEKVCYLFHSISEFTSKFQW